VTDDEIITEYEELWRKAALDDQRQFHHGPGLWETGTTGQAVCAFLYPAYVCADRLLGSAAIAVDTPWTCYCRARHTTMANAMIHLNNFHSWNWDRFANKFRTTWQEGLTR
jgi:hypothetical protein